MFILKILVFYKLLISVFKVFCYAKDCTKILQLTILYKFRMVY